MKWLLGVFSHGWNRARGRKGHVFQGRYKAVPVTRSETSYCMSRLEHVRVEQLQAYIRGHWSIEKSCHWVLDAIYREDHNQTRDRNPAANQSILRRMALNVHNRMPFEGKKRKSLPERELRATRDNAFLERLLSPM